MPGLRKLSEAHLPARLSPSEESRGEAGRIRVIAPRFAERRIGNCSDLEYTHSATAWAAVDGGRERDPKNSWEMSLHGQTRLQSRPELDCNEQEKPSLLRRRQAYTLADPVLLHPSANIVPLEYLVRRAKS